MSADVHLEAEACVVAWGANVDGESTVPAGLTGVTATAAGAYPAVAITKTGGCAP